MEKKNNFERSLAESTRTVMKTVTAEKISLSRAGNYGAAGSALAIVLVLLQMETLDFPLSISLYSAIFALPVVITLAMGTEVFLWLGEQSFSYYREFHNTPRYVLLMTAAYIALLVSFLGIVAHFSYLAVTAVILVIGKLSIEYNKFYKKLTEQIEEGVNAE